MYPMALRDKHIKLRFLKYLIRLLTVLKLNLLTAIALATENALDYFTSISADVERNLVILTDCKIALSVIIDSHDHGDCRLHYDLVFVYKMLLGFVDFFEKLFHIENW